MAIMVLGPSESSTALLRTKWAYYSLPRLIISTAVKDLSPPNAPSIFCFCFSPKAIGKLILYLLFRLKVNQYGVKALVVFKL